MRVNGTVGGTVYRGEQRVRNSADIRSITSPQVFTVTAAKDGEFVTHRFNSRSDASALKARLRREGWRARLNSSLPGKLFTVKAARGGQVWSGDFATESAAAAAVVRLQHDGWVAMVADAPPVRQGELRYTRPLEVPDKGAPLLKPPPPPKACADCHIVPCECAANVPLFLEPTVVVGLVSSRANPVGV